MATVSSPHNNTSRRVCHVDTVSGANKAGSLACRSSRRRPWSNVILWDARTHRFPAREHCDSSKTASSTYIRINNGLTGPPPPPGGTRYPGGKGPGQSSSAGSLTGTLLRRLNWRRPSTSTRSRKAYSTDRGRRTRTRDSEPTPGNLPEGILHVHLAQQYARRGVRRVTQTLNATQCTSYYVAESTGKGGQNIRVGVDARHGCLEGTVGNDLDLRRGHHHP